MSVAWMRDLMARRRKRLCGKDELVGLMTSESICADARDYIKDTHVINIKAVLSTPFKLKPDGKKVMLGKRWPRQVWSCMVRGWRGGRDTDGCPAIQKRSGASAQTPA